MKKAQLAIVLASLGVLESACSGGNAPPLAMPKGCGDTAGPTGQDVTCSCGDTVVTDTVLASADPVTRTRCAGRGLHVAGGVTLSLGGLTLSGSGVEAGIETLGHATVANGVVSGFDVGVRVVDGEVQLIGVAAEAGRAAGLVVGEPSGATVPVVTLSGGGATVADNGEAGILVHPGARLILDGVPVLRNGGVGIEVRGQLTASSVEVGWSGTDGVRIETAAPVTLQGCSIHDSAQAGVYVLAASHAEGFALAGLGSSVANNGGDGIVLGDATAQTGVVNARVSDAQITGNQVGIRVAQANSTTLRTLHRILANDIHSNAQTGLYVRTSYQWYDEASGERRAMAGNDVHHNGVQGVCTPGAGTQVASQIVFEGPIATMDPAVSDPAGPGPSYPDDRRCYFGANGLTSGTRIETAAQCDSVNDPGPASVDYSGGVANHCIWNGTQCRIAWSAGGTEGTGECGSARNRIFAYVNDPAAPPSTQRGILATSGAHVNARRNTWGIGGAVSGIFAASDSRIDADNDCGSLSTCP